MGIAIRYIDDATGDIILERIVEDFEVKALESDMASIPLWHINALNEACRRLTDKICSDALGNGSEKVEPLTVPQKQKVASALASQGIVLSPVKQMPQSIKDQIIEMAKIKSAAERQAEFEAEMGK